MGIELEGPAWAWVILVLYVIVVHPFMSAFAEAMIQDYKEAKRHED